jgi:hypothetical protein
MVTKRDSISPGLNQLIANRLGDTKATSGILTIDDDAIQLPAVTQARQIALYRITPRTADNITQKQKTHLRKILKQTNSETERSIAA